MRRNFPFFNRPKVTTQKGISKESGAGPARGRSNQFCCLQEPAGVHAVAKDEEEPL